MPRLAQRFRRTSCRAQRSISTAMAIATSWIYYCGKMLRCARHDGADYRSRPRRRNSYLCGLTSHLPTHHFSMYFNHVIEAVGKTPLVKLNKVTDGIKGTVLA